MLDNLNKEEREDLKKSVKEFRHVISDWGAHLDKTLAKLKRLQKTKGHKDHNS